MRNQHSREENEVMDTNLSSVSGFPDKERAREVYEKYRTRTVKFDSGVCPYGKDNPASIEVIGYPLPSAAEYEAMQSLCWRRSGIDCYRPVCIDCNLCIPLRLDLATWRPGKKLFALDRKNADIEVSIAAAAFDSERYHLYTRYLYLRHGENTQSEPESLYKYHQTYCLGIPVTPDIRQGISTRTGSFIIDYKNKKDGSLVANGYVDILPDGISSVYFTFDPKESGRSPGTWSVLREAQIAKEMGLHFYYLGFWIPGSPKMDYKARFGSMQISVGGRWMDASDRDEALSILHEFSRK